MREINGVYGESIESLRNLNASVLSIIKDLTIGSIITEEKFLELQKNWPTEDLSKYFTQLKDGTYML
jgi:hypothetical protein